MNQVDNWRDASILEAVTRLALNPTASPQARVFAVRHLILLLEPYYMFSYSGMTTGIDTIVRIDGLVEWPLGGCTKQMTTAPRTSINGEPLPADYETRIRATLSALANSPSVPEPVRNAARWCPTR
jgi:hypothetical protein